jgi:hypothetical protein
MSRASLALGLRKKLKKRKTKRLKTKPHPLGTFELKHYHLIYREPVADQQSARRLSIS